MYNNFYKNFKWCSRCVFNKGNENEEPCLSCIGEYYNNPFHMKPTRIKELKDGERSIL